MTEDVEVGLQVNVLPRVNQDGLILMQVRLENSSIPDLDVGVPIGFGQDGDPIISPIIQSNQALTTVSAYSGQTVVFAGLITKTRSSTRSQIPFLGSLPLIGAAFRFDTETEQRQELLVVMTPRIIQTDEDYETIKQVESSRMSWCLADVLNMHGDVGLSGGNGLWGPAKSAVIYPDMQVPYIEDRTRPYGTSQSRQYSPVLIEGDYPTENGEYPPLNTQPLRSQFGETLQLQNTEPQPLQDNNLIGEPATAPQLDSSANKQQPASAYRTVSFANPQPAQSGSLAPARHSRAPIDEPMHERQRGSQILQTGVLDCASLGETRR